MARSPAEVLGPRYFDVYRSLNQSVRYDEFADICQGQGLPPPSRRMFRHVLRLYRSRQPRYVSMNALDAELRFQRDAWSVPRVLALIEERTAESAHLEFKRRPDGPGTTAKPWAAVANSGGGAVVYGLDEDDLSRASTAVPIELDGLRERFLQVNQNIDPPVDLTIELLPLDHTSLGFCVVAIGAAEPGHLHLVDGRAPTREGTTTRYMTSEEIRRWIVESQGLTLPPPRPLKRPSDSSQLTLEQAG